MSAPAAFGGGDLAARVRAVAEAAAASGALAPIRTRVEPLDDGGWRFELRVVEALRRKPRPAGDAADPFQDPEPALVVAELPPDHRLLLNKFGCRVGNVGVFGVFGNAGAAIRGHSCSSRAQCAQGGRGARAGKVGGAAAGHDLHVERRS